MTTDGFEVLTGELDAHAGQVDALTDRLRGAVDAADTVTMNNDAYGVVCQPFAMMLQPFEELGVRTLRQAADTLADTAGSVRDTARSYTGTDSAEATVFTQTEQRL
ncbi:type VII secretion target [Actinophytocola xanthii]|uniref:ESX-1 secretion-associated protein n=1 Tax=Actinophytocola xanthii TaxID=1912961 RepID=A0A1Q8CL62_9PSEU|nr:type VII secretion target [Actinophytocola xanthii]OLF15096.1 ESX-1 secretion-associated protein [Actinophytocola xanthii]